MSADPAVFSLPTLGLTDREAMALLGLKKTRFYQIKPALERECMSLIPGLWSRELLTRYMARGQRTTAIHFPAKRPA